MFGADVLFYQAAAIKPRFLKSSKGSLKSHWYGSCIAYLGQLSNPLRIPATLDNWLVKIGFWKKTHLDSLKNRFPNPNLKNRSDWKIDQSNPQIIIISDPRKASVSVPKMKSITFGEPWNKKNGSVTVDKMLSLLTYGNLIFFYPFEHDPFTDDPAW